MKELAICIPTYERAKFIQEFLEICLPITEQFDLDVYIYDSCFITGLTQMFILISKCLIYINSFRRRIDINIYGLAAIIIDLNQN